jgi:hypothetical protein
MKRKFQLEDKEFWIEVISISDLQNYWPFFQSTTASKLKKLLLQTPGLKKIKITSTMPDIYIVLGRLLLRLPYRPFLTFAAQLYEVEEEFDLDWRQCGF